MERGKMVSWLHKAMKCSRNVRSFVQFSESAERSNKKGAGSGRVKGSDRKTVWKEPKLQNLT